MVADGCHEVGNAITIEVGDPHGVRCGRKGGDRRSEQPRDRVGGNNVAVRQSSQEQCRRTGARDDEGRNQRQMPGPRQDLPGVGIQGGEAGDTHVHGAGDDLGPGVSAAVSYTHLTLPTNREV